MAFLFDGKRFAREKELQIKKEIKNLKVVPKLVSILVGKDPASNLFVDLKRKAAQRVGAVVEVVRLVEDTPAKKILYLIKKFNKDKEIHGIMIQLPLPPNFSLEERDRIINSISKKKDVDGLQEESRFVAPVVKSVLEAMRQGILYIVGTDLRVNPLKVVVVGSKGFEGKKIFKVLKEMGYEVKGVDRETKDLAAETNEADILISATGVPGIVNAEMVKKGAIVIDIGAPKGDVVTEEVAKRASFISPVPGGIGPATISNLMENLVEAARPK